MNDYVTEVDIEALLDELRQAWPDGVSKGQCAVSALVVQDRFGGVLLRIVNEGESHYWNRLPDGHEVDMTRDQFTTWSPGEIVERDRDYVLSFPDTLARYELLKERLAPIDGDEDSEAFADWWDNLTDDEQDAARNSAINGASDDFNWMDE